MSDPAVTYPILCLAAFVAGVMNSVAGGGTLITFPALIAAFEPMGLAAAAFANGTSTVALLPGSFAGAVGYREELARSRRFILRMIAPSILGGYIGARLVAWDKGTFAHLVPWLILTAAVLFLIQQPVVRWMKQHRPDHEPGLAGQAGLIGFQFLIALYGGYFGAGIGILTLTALGFMGVGDLHRMNAVKTLLAAVINTSAVVVFIGDSLVHWPYALAMAASAIVGGYAGARVARRLRPEAVRWVVIAIGFGMSAWFLYDQYRPFG
jgi:uncharacterized membrane protein YfcA